MSDTTPETILDADLLIIGGGMAGLSAGARAAEAGKRVIVVEKSGDIGGNAMMAGGYVWTVPTARHLRGCDDGDPALGAIVIDGYADAIAWLKQRGVVISKMIPVLHGRGYQIDIIGHIRACALTIEQMGGHVVRGTSVKRLIRDESGRITGAVTTHPDGDMTVRAPWTLMATGGWQASPELRARFIHPDDRMILRAGTSSVGDGLRLVEAVGGAHAGPNPGFYGHLIADGVTLDTPAKYRTLAFYFSEHALLLNKDGNRFCDETRGDHVNTNEVVYQRDSRALLFWDQSLQERHAARPHVEGGPLLDRLDYATSLGAQGAICPTLDDLAAKATAFGFDGDACVRSIRTFNETAATAPEALSPPRGGETLPMGEAPFRIIVVQPGITFTNGGLAIDPDTRALDVLGRPIPGLLVIGADAGNIYRRGYAGGLALALTTGFRALRTAGVGTNQT